MAGDSRNPSSSGSSPRALQGQPHLDAQNVIEADSNASDGYETDAASAASTSIASSVRDYVFENNRRFHKFKEGRYLIPNDEPEQEREDMKHAMIVHVCAGKLHFAPLENPQKMLDIGTGTGAWAVDMGDEYPSAEVIGIDLSPIQPSWVPPNVKFYVDDAEGDWVDESAGLDYVHARHMSVAVKDWPKLLGQAYNALKPGGWVEVQELRLATQCDDGTMPDSYGYKRFLENLREGFIPFGIDILALDKNHDRILEAGFVNVQEKVWKVPIGTWAKDPKMKNVGLYNRSVIADALQGVSMLPFTRGLGWSMEEVEVFLTEVRRSLTDTSIHSYFTFHTVYGQKPQASG